MDRESSNNQFNLLIVYRRNLSLCLGQRAMHSASSVPPVIGHNIREARQGIARAKAALRDGGYPVDDEPDDIETAPMPVPRGGDQRVKLTIDARVSDLADLQVYSRQLFRVEEL